MTTKSKDVRCYVCGERVPKERTHVARHRVPSGLHEVVREFFVANFLDSDDSGRVTVDGAALADAVAEMFSSDAWDETLVAAIAAQCERVMSARAVTK